MWGEGGTEKGIAPRGHGLRALATLVPCTPVCAFLIPIVTALGTRETDSFLSSVERDQQD